MSGNWVGATYTRVIVLRRPAPNRQFGHHVDVVRDAVFLWFYMRRADVGDAAALLGGGAISAMLHRVWVSGVRGPFGVV